jgi:hypothetical protein
MYRFLIVQLVLLFQKAISWTAIRPLNRQASLSMSVGSFVKYQGLGNDFVLVVSFLLSRFVVLFRVLTE